MKKLILIASVFMSIFSVSAGMQNLKDQAPTEGSAANFFINFIKAAPQMGLEEAKKNATEAARFYAVEQKDLDRYATIDFEKPFRWIELPQANGFVRVQVRYTHASGDLSQGVMLKKIDGKWMFASKNADKDK